MKVTRKGEYGMRALCRLAAEPPGGLVQIREIAASGRIPAKYLETILAELKRAGFLTSRRGAEGGYGLARPADEIFVGEVLRVLDGPLSPLGGAAELRRRVDEHPDQAGFYAVLIDVRNAVSAILDRTSVADLVERGRKLGEARAARPVPAIRQERSPKESDR